MRSIIFSVQILFVTLLLSGCLETVEERGYATDMSEFGALAGDAPKTKEYVLDVLGSPSTKSNFGKETWYYIKTKTERIAFFEPDTLEQNVVAITFNDEGIVENIEHYTRDNMRNIDFAADKTPTEGNKLSIVEQLLGNLGRFNPSNEGK